MGTLSGFWDFAAPLYDLVTAHGNQGAQDAVAYVATRTSPADLLLDTACGTGLFACALAPSVWRVLACDLSPRMVARTRAKARRLHLNNLAARTGDLTHLPLPDDCVDTAVAGNVLHLLDQPERGVAELRRVTRPGGLIAVANYVADEATDNSRNAHLLRRVGFKPVWQWRDTDVVERLGSWGLKVEEHQVFPAFRPMCVALCRNV